MSIEQNLAKINTSISDAEQKYHRPSGSTLLLAVSKMRTTAEIRHAYTAGQTHFGENYWQEAEKKIADLADCDITWHFIGPIQSNKTQAIASHFSWVHSLADIKHAQRLNDQRPSDLPPLNVCVQVNISQESSKNGIELSDLLEFCTFLKKMPHLRLRGLMTLPALSENFEEQRQPFHQLHLIYEELNEEGFNLDTLSMGTSHDYLAAIAEGATMVRIGTSIFGPRDRSNTE